MTGKAAGQSVYWTQPPILGQLVVAVPVQPFVLSTRSRARPDPVGPVMGFVPSPAPVRRIAANGRLLGVGRFMRSPPAAVAMPRKMRPPRAKPSVYDSQAPLL